MAITDRFATTEELQEILVITQALNNVRTGLLEVFENISTDIFVGDDGFGKTFAVHDSNGECLGHIGQGTDGLVFYFDDGSTR